MTDGDRKRRAAERLANAQMQPERPLDALVPELGRPASPTTPLHPRVLESAVGDGLEWTLILWTDPGDPQALHGAVKALVEATFLAELSRTPESVRGDGQRRFDAVRLVSFADLDWDPAPALHAFGFTLDEGVDEALNDRLGAILDEAPKSGHDVPERATQVWTARIDRGDETLAGSLHRIEQMMADQMGDEVWGLNPGDPARLLAAHLRQMFDEAIDPTLDGVRTVESLLVSKTSGVVRWLPPLLFQALCDLLPVVASIERGARIGWAESQQLSNGFMHPPLIQVDDPQQGAIHIPIGQHVLRWCIMPVGPDEELPSLADWLDDQFEAPAD